MGSLITLLSIKQDELHNLKEQISEVYHRDSGGKMSVELFKYINQLENEILELSKKINKGE